MKLEQSERSVTASPKIEDDCYDWYERHALKCRETASRVFDLVFIGDSLTHFWAGESGCDYGSAVWTQYYGRRRVQNLGFGFDRTQNVLWRLEHGELDGQTPKLIVLNIGTNQFSGTPRYPRDTPEAAAAGIRAVSEKIRSMFPGTFLILTALFPRGTAGSELARLTGETNRLVKSFAVSEKSLFLDLGAQTGFPDHSARPEFFQPDLTHLNERGYRVWAEALEPHIRRILDDGPEVSTP